MKLSQFDELSAPKQLARLPRIKPNIFARLVRFSWNNAALVLIFWLLFNGLAALVLSQFWQVPSSTRLPLPVAQSVLPDPAGLNDLMSLQTITISNSDAEVLATQRSDLAAELRENHDIYELVFAPGGNDFYDDYGMLFRPLEEIQARVAYALSLKPLFDAVAAAPSAQSLTTLVSEIAGSVQQGRGSQGVTDLLNEAGDAVQALANGEDKPLDWSKVAALNLPVNATSLTILALPRLGKESAARDITTRLLEGVQNSSHTKIQLVQAVIEQTNHVTARVNLLRIVAATLIGIAFSGLLLAVFVGRMKLLLLIFAPAAMMVALVMSLFMVIGSANWTSYWPAIFAILFCYLLLAVRFLLKFPMYYDGQNLQKSDVMLIAQQHSKDDMLLAATMASPWIALAIIMSSVLLLPALITTVCFLCAPLCVSTVLTACLRYWPKSLHWQAREWLQPAHRTLFETHYWQIAAPVLGVLILGASFLLAMTSWGGNTTVRSDARVSIIANDRGEVESLISRLKSFSGAQSVRWIGMFVPSEAEEKLSALRGLMEKFPRIAPVQSEPPSDLRDQIDSMQDSLKRIAVLAGQDKGLADAADQFRRSLALLSASDRDQPITQVENRLFGGFNRLADRASRLASLAPIDIETLPPELHRLFGHGAGPYRIEVEAAAGITNDRLALALDQAGFNVTHPAVQQAHFESQKNRLVMQVTGLAIGLVILTLILTLHDVRRWLSLALLTAASVVVVIATYALWRSEINLPWLLGVMALLSCYGGTLNVAMTRHETSAASVIEVFMLPSIALALASAYYLLDVPVVSNEATPLAVCVFLVALIISLFHHHSSTSHQEDQPPL